MTNYKVLEWKAACRLIMSLLNYKSRLLYIISCTLECYLFSRFGRVQLLNLTNTMVKGYRGRGKGGKSGKKGCHRGSSRN